MTLPFKPAEASPYFVEDFGMNDCVQRAFLAAIAEHEGGNGGAVESSVGSEGHRSKKADDAFANGRIGAGDGFCNVVGGEDRVSSPSERVPDFGFPASDATGDSDSHHMTSPRRHRIIWRTTRNGIPG